MTPTTKINEEIWPTSSFIMATDVKTNEVRDSFKFVQLCEHQVVDSITVQMLKIYHSWKINQKRTLYKTINHFLSGHVFFRFSKRMELINFLEIRIHSSSTKTRFMDLNDLKKNLFWFLFYCLHQYCPWLSRHSTLF